MNLDKKIMIDLCYEIEDFIYELELELNHSSLGKRNCEISGKILDKLSYMRMMCEDTEDSKVN